MCFRSAESNYEERCFDIMVFEVGKDQCGKIGDAITGPCQNGGICFPGDNKHVCFCPKGYTGENCEKGPCQESDNKCENGGFCLVDNHVISCLCKAGFTGNLCDTDISDGNGNTSVDGGVFTLEGSAQTVNCNRNRMCGLYAPVAYTSIEKPTVAMGYISPTLEVDSVQTEQEIAVGRYITSVLFLPKEVGTFLLCLQTLNMERINKDELCHKVFVTDGVDLVYGFEDRPLFVMPSLQPSVVIECEESTVCHVTYTATPGVGHEHNCLDIQVSSGGIELLHTFTSCDACVDGFGVSNNCSIDISFKPSFADDNKQVCVDLILKSGNVRGEERCFNVSILPSGDINAKKGCQLLGCRNGGFCDGHDPDKPLCSCMKGYTGTQCETKLGSTHTGICKPSFLEGSVVTEFECVTDNTCIYQFEICSSISPLVTLGYNNPSLNLGTPALKPPTSSGSCQCSTGSVELRPTIASTDAFKFCLQQVLSDGSTGDELCPSVFVSDTRSSGAVDTKKPYFLQPTLPSGSVLLCKLNETCYLDLHYTDGSTFGSSLECPKLRESSGHSLNGLHIFPFEHASNECINDVSFQHPSTASGGDIFEYCFKVSIPGKQGEQRCFQLKITSNLNTSVDSLCKDRVCHGQARCIADFTANNAQCICPVGFTGSDCSQVVNKTRNLPGVENASVSKTDTPHFDIHHAIPKVIECEEGYPCKIEIAYMGETTKTPVLGYCDRNLTGHAQVSVVSLSGQEHLLVSTVNGKAGTYKCCYQTTTTGTDIGENIDEICFHVDIKTQGTVPTSDPNKPRFISPATNSSFTCTFNSICHVTMLTEKDGSTCTQVKECGQGLTGVHVFTTEEMGGQCITDVGFKTSDQEETHILCAKAGPNGEERQIILEVKNCSGFGPCQKLHCKNGGTCVSMTDAAVCLCRNGFTDTECQIEINECDPVPCVHGSCTDLVNGYSCTCEPGYEGFNCTEEIDECLSNPCIHGTCVDLVNGYTCACESGYEGSNCEINVDECVGVICQHGGTCDDGVNMYRCRCTSGWEGTHCETDINECSSNPCINDGNCTDEIDGYSCVCNKQFTGMHCELERGGRIHQVITPNNPQPPSFTEYTIPEIIRCRVNASCTIVLPVDGELNKPPNVQNGHYSPGLIVSPPKTTESNPARCVNGRCAFDAHISVVATFVSFFKYCVQTTDYQNVNADELCYQIESYIPSTTPGKSSFIQPPTIPNNSTMKCPVGKPCVYIVEIKRPPDGCKDKLTPEGSPPNTMVHLVPFGNIPTCKYEVVFTPEPLQQESHVLLCFRTDFDRHCSKVHVQRENEIAQSTGGCSQLHCVNGGFCDSSSRPSCQCQPGFMGDTCAKPDEKCVVGSIPDQVVCNQQSCSLEFLVTGSITVPVVVETEQHLLPEIFPDSIDIGTYYLSLKVTGAVASGSRVCIKTESNGKSGNCSSTDCTTIVKDDSMTTIQSVLNCTETDSAGKCLPIVMTTRPFSNKTCPQLSVHQDTTLASVHVFENKLVDSHDPRCVAIVTAFPSGGSSNKDRLCLTDSLSGVRCMTAVTSNQKKCDSGKATARARKSVSSGLVSCFCEVHGQKLPIIITRPQIKTERLIKVAGYGAGGMAGAMIVGVLIYLIISGVKGDRKIDSYGRPMPVGKPMPFPRPNSMNSLIDAKARLKARRIYPNSVDSF
ncbi:neurogenic locus Notch protein-like [Mya arenaria]|uniref:neurogenic locus Notch protein-like n=1 Tax=Mya arenaria TaxID=6604 RepID=UPI0022E2BE4E|nr:neurogenic locus Notch protein-like [Mya arenaria]